GSSRYLRAGFGAAICWTLSVTAISSAREARGIAVSARAMNSMRVIAGFSDLSNRSLFLNRHFKTNVVAGVLLFAFWRAAAQVRNAADHLVGERFAGKRVVRQWDSQIRQLFGQLAVV